MKLTPILAAVLMLGGVGYAYAQGYEEPAGASEKGSATQERGGSDAGARGRDAGAASGKQSEKEGRAAQQTEEKGKSEPKAAKSKEDDAAGSGTMTEDDKAGTKDKAAAKDKEKEKAATPGDTAKDTAKDKDATDRQATDTKEPSAAPKAAEGTAPPDKAKQADLSGDKRTQVQSAFRDAGKDVKHRTNVDIDISVGTRLPRDWDFVPVPAAVIAIVPEYRDYVFAYVEDQYVIVEPDTYEVVAVLPAERGLAGTSGQRTAGAGKCSTNISLSTQEKELVFENVGGGREADVAELSVGREVPSGVELLTFPDSVLTEVKELEGCQYFDAGDRIAIVNPDEDKIVLLLDKG